MGFLRLHLQRSFVAAAAGTLVAVLAGCWGLVWSPAFAGTNSPATAAVNCSSSSNDDAPAKATDETKFVSLFNGTELTGWNGERAVFRIEDHAIVGGNLNEKIPHNFFLATEQEYSDFELRLEFRLKVDNTNAGVQLRSERIPDHHEMIGYQADLGQNYWGCLYDESRRNKVLAAPKAEELEKVLRKNDWNSYRILCQGNRIQLWINDLKTVDYIEEDSAIVQKGRIALQIHGGPPGEAWYRRIRIRKL